MTFPNSQQFARLAHGGLTLRRLETYPPRTASGIPFGDCHLGIDRFHRAPPRPGAAGGQHLASLPFAYVCLPSVSPPTAACQMMRENPISRADASLRGRSPSRAHGIHHFEMQGRRMSGLESGSQREPSSWGSNFRGGPHPSVRTSATSEGSVSWDV
jgi:hypothetical protein